MYVMNCIMLDIAYSISKLSTFKSNLSMDNWKVIKRVLKYLKHIVDYGLYYISYPVVLEIYNDANWISVTMNSNPQVDISSHLVEKLYHENLPNKHVLLDPRCNQSLLLLIKLERKLNEFGIF
jgi:hypothetical protein